jgi:hypothetical protein
MPRHRPHIALGLAAAFVVFMAAVGASGTGHRTRPDTALAAEKPALGTAVRPADPVLASPGRSSVAVAAGSLDGVLEQAGYLLPLGTDVYVTRILPGGDGVTTYEMYEAGGGGNDTTLWPASSVKVLAAVGTLAYLRDLGFTGAAVVGTEDWSATVHELYDEALRYSSNDAYDHLVEIAGVDWLNEYFLTGANGFGETVIQRSYAYGDVISSPPMTLSEAGRTEELPARTPEVDLGVPEGGNRSTPAEMVDSVRRVVLDAELPDSERLGLDPTDLAAMADALLGAEGFLEPGVVDALGTDALVYNKPGWVSGESCVDVGLVVDPVREQRFLLGIASPDDGTDCAALGTIAGLVLSWLQLS